ncbi:MAG: NADPH:quinone oxidoreductase [Gammaproteobacteria bacterium]|nr:NADPH:quinone oxidoreductase [Gammaproteobacteria bacterium]
MKSVICHEISEDISTVSFEEIDLRAPKGNEVQIKIMACAVNFPDLLMIQGKYQFKPPLPFSPGGEFSGEVVDVGEDVTGFSVGDRVVGGARYGGFSEAINIEQNSLRHLPINISFAKAASYSTAYLTALVALKVRGRLQPNETLLVHGATGGVGMAAVDLGKHMGAKIIATGGTDQKLKVVKERGADHVINYSMPNNYLGGFKERVKELTDGKGADVIFDPVGGTVFDESMRCINWDGRILTIGFTSGVWPQAPVNHILIKQISVIGVRAGEIGRRNPELGRQTREEIFELLTSGAINPHVCAAFPLEDSVNAMKMLEERKVVGKVVVTANGYSPSKSD